jgi:hypothetical protein
MSVFQETKLLLVDTFGLSKDALHIYVGLIVFFGTALLFRLPLRDIRPVLAVLLAALAGELWDIYDTAAIGAPQVYAGNWHDIWNTMFWPLAIMLLARFTGIVKR